jgi:predicted CXXCH cytochrome family protein
MSAFRALVGVLLAACIAAPAACADRSGGGGAPPRRDPSAADGGVAYVDDASCAGCHAREHEAWSGSHHDLAMQEASAETVLGDFDGATFTHFGVTSRFFTRDGRFFVNTEGPDGRLADFEIAYTFGIEPLQQYLAPFPGGYLQSLTIAWDTERGAWIHLYPDREIPPADPLHWTGRYQRWNVMCAECHSTHLRPNHDLENDTYRTTWAAIDVGCQACHGPGAAHVDWARAGPMERASTSAAGLLVDLRAGGAESEIRACAGCHSRRQRLTEVDGHARPFLDDFLPARLDEGLYYPDGQIRDEVYVWGSFVQSRMHAAGVRCSDCHDPHRLGLRAAGDAVCLQCHRESPVERFPSLAPGRYDTPDHHFHPPDSAGARCVSCHMPARTYMQVDPRRDHGFRIPRPDLSVALGTPNACTGCHSDRTDQWAADQAVAWWETSPEPHFATALAAARAGTREAEEPLLAVAGDRSLPAIVRATAVEALRGYGPAALRAIEAAVTDADPLVRASAAGGLDRLPPPRRAAALAPLLDDPLRAVRIEAARGLAGVPRTLLTEPQRLAFDAARVELVAAQLAAADQPGAHLNLGVLAAAEDRPDAAEAAYRTALRLDPFFAPA